VLATPLQMANVAATIARDGLWVRPRLVTCEADLAAKPSATQPAPLDREDLHLSPGALAAVKEGMFRVVNTRAGSGYERIHRPDVAIAGKTGTAQVQRLSIVRRDEKGNVVRDEKGQVLRDYPAVSTRKEPNPAMPWYRGGAQHDNDLSHAWFIGFAPARNPQIAFAVALEYGGSGGRDAAPVANALLDACIKHGYLSVDKRGPGRD
jgi:penicillin-binding protein 2